MTIQEAIREVVAGRRLSEPQAASVALGMMRGDATAAQIAGLLVGLRLRCESVEEIAGFVRSMREGATLMTPPFHDVMDTCGTGGDGQGTFNISTACAFVAAAAGCKVAKHGNRAVSSRCGSADVLEFLGVNIELSPEQTSRCISEIGVGFLFSPQYHAGAKNAVTARRELGIRSIFNTIGPMLHPMGVRRQLVGVYSEDLLHPVAEVLRQLGAKHCLIVHGEDGLDEITITGRTMAIELKDSSLHRYIITPEQFGMEAGDLAAVLGGDKQVNAQILQDVLGKRLHGPARDIVLLNAGAAIYVGGRADSIAEGIRQAADAIDSHIALHKLDALAKFSRSVSP